MFGIIALGLSQASDSIQVVNYSVRYIVCWNNKWSCLACDFEGLVIMKMACGQSQCVKLNILFFYGTV